MCSKISQKSKVVFRLCLAHIKTKLLAEQLDEPKKELSLGCQISELSSFNITCKTYLNP